MSNTLSPRPPIYNGVIVLAFVCAFIAALAYAPQQNCLSTRSATVDGTDTRDSR